MERFLQYLFDGLSNGAIYALLALGLVVIFRGTGQLNFAQGEMGMFSTFVVWQIHDWGVPFVLSCLIGVVFGFLLGATIEMTLIRPVSSRSHSGVFVVTIALFLAFNSLAANLWVTAEQKGFPSLFPNGDFDFQTILGANWSDEAIGILVATLVITAGLFALFRYTRFGLAMRAVASNSDSSRLVGIRNGRVLAASWGLAIALATIGGIFVAGRSGLVDTSMMFQVFIFASAAATLGGLDSLGGAVIGGLGFGIARSMLAGYQPDWIGDSMSLGVALLIIFVIMLFRPTGLFGTAKVERV
jgi:branched-chain amino acid transport system permease protein